jgi:hypothetical protein
LRVSAEKTSKTTSETKRRMVKWRLEQIFQITGSKGLFKLDDVIIEIPKFIFFDIPIF